MTALAGVIIALIIGAERAVSLFRTQVRPYDSWVQYGGPDKPWNLTDREREVLFHETIRQYRSAYGLQWFSVGLGVVLCAIIVGRVALARQFDVQVLTSVVGLLGDITLNRYANYVYRVTGERLDNLLASLGAPPAT